MENIPFSVMLALHGHCSVDNRGRKFMPANVGPEARWRSPRKEGAGKFRNGQGQEYDNLAKYSETIA